MTLRVSFDHALLSEVKGILTIYGHGFHARTVPQEWMAEDALCGSSAAVRHRHLARPTATGLDRVFPDNVRRVRQVCVRRRL